MSETLIQLSKALNKNQGGYKPEHVEFYNEYNQQIVLIGAMLGRLTGLNERVTGWYPGSDYPYLITIVYDDRVGQYNALGKCFEYSPISITLIPRGKSEVPEDVAILQNLGNWIKLLHTSEDQAMYDYIKTEYDIVYQNSFMAVLRHSANIAVEYGTEYLQQLLIAQLKTPLEFNGVTIKNSDVEKMTMLIMLMQSGMDFDTARDLCALHLN
jgi:hypothetical protein